VTMRIEIKRIQNQLGITSVFVTHDQEECFSISDKVAVMNKGVIEQFDTPEEIYKNPKTEFVARFIGFENFFGLTQIEEGMYKAVDGTVFLSTRKWETGKHTGTIRPDDIDIVASAEANTNNTLSGVIKVRTFLGKSYQYEIETSIGTLLVNEADDVIYQVGDAVTLSIPSHKLTIV